MGKKQQRIERLLRKALLEDGDMAEALYDFELEEHIDYWYEGVKRDRNEYVFVVTHNNGDVAMVLITADKTLYKNEAGREKLKELWKTAYRSNIQQLLPMMAADLAEDIFAVNGVNVVGLP